MLERDIERRLRERVKEVGGYCLKFITPGFTGVPDRIILLPGGVIAFAELKAPGKRERQRQLFVQASLRRLGFKVFSAVDSYDKVEDVCAWCRSQSL